MIGEIIDIFATILAVLVLHYMVVLLLVRSSGKQEPWRSALELWNEARREWKRARASLRQATRDLKRAQRRTRRRPKGMVAVAKRESEETILKLRSQKQTAKKRACSTHKRFQDKRKPLDDASSDVYKVACNNVTCKLEFYRTATGNLWEPILNFTKSTCNAFKSVTIRIMTHHPIIAGVTLTLAALAYDSFYYSRFNFNILPFYSDPAGDTLNTVVFVVLATTVALLIFLSTFIFSIIVIPLSAFLFVAVSLIWAVVFVLGRPSAWALGIYHRSAKHSQLILLLIGRLAGWLKVLQDFLNTIDQMVHRLIEKITDQGFRERVRKATVCGVWLLFFVLTIPALMYVAFIEPQYRAHQAYRGDNRIRVVVDQPPDGVSDPMIKIGSNGSYLFAVKSPSTAAAGACEGKIGTVQELDHGNVEMQSQWIEVVVKSVSARYQFVRSKLLPDNGATCNISEDKGSNRKFLSELWLRAAGGLKFILNFLPSDFKGAVIALPPARVHCVYEDASGQAAKLCAPSASDDQEGLLRKQLAREIGCQTLMVSKPFVFMPGDWINPLDGVEAQVEEFLRKCCSALGKESTSILYVVGFASADGPGDHNKKLASDRAKAILETIRNLIRKKFPRWNIRTESLGEDHLTSGVADSRSARLVFCAEEQGGGPPSPNYAASRSKQCPPAGGKQETLLN